MSCKPLFSVHSNDHPYLSSGDWKKKICIWLSRGGGRPTISMLDKLCLSSCTYMTCCNKAVQAPAGAFGSLFGLTLNYIERDGSRVQQTNGKISTTVCSQVMRGEKHYVTCQVEDGSSCGIVSMGIIQLIQNWEGMYGIFIHLGADRLLLCTKRTMVDGATVM